MDKLAENLLDFQKKEVADIARESCTPGIKERRGPVVERLVNFRRTVDTRPMSHVELVYLPRHASGQLMRHVGGTSSCNCTGNPAKWAGNYFSADESFVRFVPDIAEWISIGRGAIDWRIYQARSRLLFGLCELSRINWLLVPR